MAIATINNMTIGQTERFRVKLYADDPSTNNPSTIVDTTTALTVTSQTANATAHVDPSDPRAIIVTASAAGTVSVLVDAPTISGTNAASNRLLSQAQVAAPHVNNARIDFVSADPPA